MKSARNLRCVSVSKGREGGRLCRPLCEFFWPSTNPRTPIALSSMSDLSWPTPDVVVTLFHVLKPMPRELLEHGGSENPATEAD